LNAIIHKKYESGIPIQISVYDDRLYIANIGQLPENWSLEILMGKHASRPYNPNIANTFYLAGFIESWGRGIEKIFGACEEDGVLVPIYTVNPGDIMIKFTAPEDRIITSRRNEEVNETINETINRSYKILSAIRKNSCLTRM
jgi:ATP-dependent DNA helicase RecG